MTKEIIKKKYKCWKCKTKFRSDEGKERRIGSALVFVDDCPECGQNSSEF